MLSAVAEQTSKRGERFFHSVMWSWFGVAVSIFSGIFLSAYVIHKVGHVAAGVWALIFSVVENFGMMDFGFRSATLKYAAHYRALGEPDKVNESDQHRIGVFSFGQLPDDRGNAALCAASYAL